MPENELRLTRCCFTGHRPEKLIMGKENIDIVEKEMKKRLKKAVCAAIEDGFITFITGMARGLDLWAADVVLEEKKEHPELKLICALPFDGFEKRWNEKDRKHYRDILSKADYVQVVCARFSMGSFQMRNEYMVNHANRVIAAYNGEAGGTRNTINYARKQGVLVVNILEDEVSPK